VEQCHSGLHFLRDLELDVVDDLPLVLGEDAVNLETAAEDFQVGGVLRGHRLGRGVLGVDRTDSSRRERGDAVINIREGFSAGRRDSVVKRQHVKQCGFPELVDDVVRQFVLGEFLRVCK